MKILFILPFVCFLLGCPQASIEPIYPSKIARIDLNAQLSNVEGFAGEVKQDSILAIPRDAKGIALPGVSINFAIEHPAAWKGVIYRFAQDTVSDADGNVRALYQVKLDSSGQVVIEAMWGNIIARDTINLILIQGGIRAEY
jgi:hypothetical protein